MPADADVKKLFGIKLAQLRKAQGMSQEALALESGISRSYLGDVERGHRNISLVNICRLAQALGLRLAEFMDFSIEHTQGKARSLR
ncbi:helix-turn-helix domain-containing protein [Polaromonas sp.]|uniref:helix-turn-helix domain-containing protein n=1 Tax=Polaromonas sp. TaxID=1869339 RepID=UPI00352B744E